MNCYYIEKDNPEIDFIIENINEQDLKIYPECELPSSKIIFFKPNKNVVTDNPFIVSAYSNVFIYNSKTKSFHQREEKKRGQDFDEIVKDLMNIDYYGSGDAIKEMERLTSNISNQSIEELKALKKTLSKKFADSFYLDIVFSRINVFLRPFD